MMKRFIILWAILSVVGSCTSKEKVPMEWVLQNTYSINEVNPIGIALKGEELWVSDGDHNRLVQIDTFGVVLKVVDNLDRPMHIAANDHALYVPQYGNDTIAILSAEGKSNLKLTEEIDAPAGVALYKNEKAIADFYHNRILFYNGENWISFGKEGNKEGQFYYPTDVQITETAIWVADAYNHRIQVFDKTGNFIKAMGKDQKMNAATGIYISETEVFVTDFENSRILIFDHDGVVKQKLRKSVHKPTDMLVFKDKLYSINYRKGTLNKYQLQPIKSETTK